jgi:hypothetical protein
VHPQQHLDAAAVRVLDELGHPVGRDPAVVDEDVLPAVRRAVVDEGLLGLEAALRRLEAGEPRPRDGAGVDPRRVAHLRGGGEVVDEGRLGDRRQIADDRRPPRRRERAGAVDLALGERDVVAGAAGLMNEAAARVAAVVTSGLKVTLTLEPAWPRISVVVTGGTLRRLQHSLVNRSRR